MSDVMPLIPNFQPSVYDNLYSMDSNSALRQFVLFDGPSPYQLTSFCNILSYAGFLPGHKLQLCCVCELNVFLYKNL